MKQILEPGFDYSHISFHVGAMGKSVSTLFFEHLHFLGFLSEEESNFLRKICGHKSLSTDQARLYDEMMHHCHQNSFYKAVDCAKKIHAIGLSDKMRKHGWRFTTTSNRRVILDDSDVAYELGCLLEPRFPAHALKSFEILKESSPLYPNAQKKIADLSVFLHRDGLVNSKEILRSMFMTAGHLQNEEDIENLKLFLKFIESYTDFAITGTESRLFNPTDEIDTSKINGPGFKLILKSFIQMADKIIELKSKIRKLTSSEPISLPLDISHTSAKEAENTSGDSVCEADRKISKSH